MDPDDGGFVCMKMLNKWSYGMRLFDFIKNIEEMVANPNPDGPFGTESCMAAAKFFSENKARFTVTIRQG
jgi:ubiquitin-protein ligase